MVATSGPLRIQYSGARYQVMSRGDRREAIFYEDAVKGYRFKKPVEF
jgi:hypothetical protein